jgi:AICAR transformylase/IMP cyclohydrolase PurH
MVRSAAKNHASSRSSPIPPTIALCRALDAMAARRLELRKRLAAKALPRPRPTIAAIANWFAFADQAQRFPSTCRSAQAGRAALRREPASARRLYLPRARTAGASPRPSRSRARQLSYNNYNDADAALELSRSSATGRRLRASSSTPIPAASPAATAARGLRAALACDTSRPSAGSSRVNRPLDGAAAEAIVGSSPRS